MALLVHMELALIHKFDHCDNFHFEVRNQDCNTVPVGACIYVGDRVDKSELQLIASDDSLAFTIDTFDFLAIQQLQDRISEQLCGTQSCNITDCPRGSQCKIYEPTGEPFCEPSCDLDNGGCADDETCSLRNVTCARAPCPPVVECSSCTLGGLDLIFVLDVSISIRSDRFQLIRDFVARVSSRLDVGPENSLAGVILFGDDAQIHFDLQDNLNQADLLSAIARIPYLRLRGTNTHTALELLREGARDGRLGLRDGRPHVVIVITDGRATRPGPLRRAARNLHAENFYEVYAAGVGNRVDEAELHLIASDPSLAFLIDRFDLTAI